MHAYESPDQQHRSHQAARQALLHTSAALATCLAVLIAVVAGTGWLYLLRNLQVLDLGPAFSGALPLQQLAGGDAQPFARMLVAWLPAGLALGVVLASATRLPRVARAAVAGTGAAALLLPAAAISDAVAQNDSVRMHISGALSSGGIWLAVVLIAVGVLIAPPLRVARQGGGAAASAI